MTGELTVEGIDSDLLTLLQRFLDALFFDTLDAEIGEAAEHCWAVDLKRADTLFTAVFADQTVRMRSVWWVLRHTRYHHNGSTAITHYLYH